MPLPDPKDDALALADELRPALHRLYRQLRRESEALDLGISPLQNLLLAVILEHPGIGVGDLARLEKLRSPTISGHIKAMETAGLVTRAVPQPDDRRRVGLLVTEKGREIIEALRRHRRDWLARQLAALSPDGRQAIRQAIGPLSEIGR
ncbi:MAG: MarR family transcriptional regulator [Dongiaceae bacterium]